MLPLVVFVPRRPYCPSWVLAMANLPRCPRYPFEAGHLRRAQGIYRVAARFAAAASTASSFTNGLKAAKMPKMSSQSWAPWVRTRLPPCRAGQVNAPAGSLIRPRRCHDSPRVGRLGEIRPLSIHFAMRQLMGNRRRELTVCKMAIPKTPAPIWAPSAHCQGGDTFTCSLPSVCTFAPPRRAVLPLKKLY